jgi:colanic acid/amylovoran biosynthesis glycosyltransferase
MKLAYITVKSPLGKSESFLLAEMLELRRHCELLIAPLRPEKSIFSQEAFPLESNCLRTPLLNAQIALGFLLFSLTHILVIWTLLADLTRHSRSPSTLMKNLAVLPKAVYLAKVFARQKVSHIHAHWGSSTSTCAYIAARLSNIPWSMTLHRWDIKENNMLREKATSAMFIRTISEEGKLWTLQIVRDGFANKVHVIHMGVSIPLDDAQSPNNAAVPTIACIANFIPVKGHIYFLQACALLIRKGINFKCLLIGEGPGINDLRYHVRALGLEDATEVRLFLPHEEILQLFATRCIQVLVVPSITTEDGQTEGIPVTLMEAMAYKIPVVATSIGSIPELLGDDGGWLVPQKDPEAIANAIETILDNPARSEEFVHTGFHKVNQAFNVDRTSVRLYDLMLQYSGQAVD